MNNGKNKWCARLAYKCGVCGKEHESIKDRAECELKCLQRKEQEERLAAEKKKKEEKESRKKEVDLAFEKFLSLKGDYCKDYGVYAYGENIKPLEFEINFRDLFNMLP